MVRLNEDENCGEGLLDLDAVLVRFATSPRKLRSMVESGLASGILPLANAMR